MGFKYIKLSQGKRTKVDKEDYEKLKGLNFVYCISKTQNYGYASCTTPPYRNKRLHRILLNVPKGKVVDHINRDGLDNRRQNLRVVSISQNNVNCKVNNKHGLTGVNLVTGYLDKWQSKIRVKGKDIHLGTFKTKHAASKAYKKARLHYYGV